MVGCRVLEHRAGLARGFANFVQMMHHRRRASRERPTRKTESVGRSQIGVRGARVLLLRHLLDGSVESRCMLSSSSVIQTDTKIDSKESAAEILSLFAKQNVTSISLFFTDIAYCSEIISDANNTQSQRNSSLCNL